MKYKKLVFLVCFVFLTLFFIPTLTFAASPVCSPVCGYNETCIDNSASNQKNYCQVNLNSGSGNRYLDNTGGTGEGGVIVPACDATNSCNTVTDAPPKITTTGTPSTIACQSLAGDPSTYFQQGLITGTGPVNTATGLIPLSAYNNDSYATAQAAGQLAACLGGTLGSTPASSGFYIPSSIYITQPDGTISNAGIVLQMLQGCNGDLSCWKYKLSQADQPLVGGGTSATGTGSTGSTGTSLNVTSKSSSVSVGSSGSGQTSADKAVADIQTQVDQQQKNYVNQIGQITNSICGTSPDCQNLNNLQTQLYQTGSGFVKPIFTTNASGVMHVGDTWNITVTGLNPGETIYATGGKKVNGIVPTDKTPYAANSLGVFFETGTHQKDVIGDWQIAWTRGDGTVLGTMTFSVADNTTPIQTYTTPTNPVTIVPTTPSCAATATCTTIPKISNFSYIFTKVDNAWKVTLDNAALGSPTDKYYVPANYSITAGSSADMNMQNQYRFNNSVNFPGYHDGDSFYTEMFNAYNRAFYDWNKQTNTAVSSSTSTLANSLTVNGLQSVTLNVGDQANYIWNSTSGNSFESYYKADKPDTCSGGFTGTSATQPWVANTARGSTSQIVQPCQAGVTYTITFVIHGVAGVADILKTAVVSVSNNVAVKAVPVAEAVTPLPCGLTMTCARDSVVVPITPVVVAKPAPVSVPVVPIVPVVTSTDTLASNYSSSIGVYHWGVFSDPLGSVLGGVNFAASKGFKIMRLALSPRSSIDYGSSTTCDSGLPLNKLILLNGFPQALANSSINTFILTTYDSATFGDCATKKYMNPSFFTTANTTAVTQEYYDLAMYLYQTYKNTGKKFILDNWEGDNDLYCGDAYGYATSASSRATCDAKYQTTYSGNTSVNDSIIGMKDWLTARTAGISKARADAASQGLGGVSVVSAGELSIVKVLHDNGYKSMLYDVLPGISLDYVSYSSYESINNSTPATTLATDIQTIKNITGNNNIIVGEFGYSADQVGLANAENYLQQVAQIVSSAGATYGIVWDLFDQPGSNFGLFTQQKTPSLFSALKNKSL
jgi:hypothetical protein